MEVGYIRYDKRAVTKAEFKASGIFDIEGKNY